MNILFLGDIVGDSGCIAVKENLPKIIKDKSIDFVVANGENAAKEGVGITENITNELINSGVDVITTGNHVWDQKETYDFISKQNRLLRPLNLLAKSPGKGFDIYNSRKGFKIGVLNLMGNIFMKKSDDVFESARNVLKEIKLKENADFIIVDMHGEITSEKKAMGHFFDGRATLVVGTHTHIPTSDHMILQNGTAYQTDLGMCGDYDSIIGMNKENSLKKFLKDNSAQRHFPADGEGTISGLMVEANDKTGLAQNCKPIIIGKHLQNTI